MSGNHYLVDTNVFIGLLNKHPSVANFLEDHWYYSFITEIELLGKVGIKAAEIKEIKSLLGICTKIIHSDLLDDLVIKLRQQSKIKIPDALIASTSMHYNLPLLTFDKDLAKVKGLSVVLLS
jgi:predicted nucleic acid-binding protein